MQLYQPQGFWARRKCDKFTPPAVQSAPTCDFITMTIEQNEIEKIAELARLRISNEEIGQVTVRIAEILEEQFDIAADAVTPAARLREDLDIDSIDAVNLMIELKSITAKKITLENFHQVKTIDDLIDSYYNHPLLRQRVVFFNV